VSVCSLLGSIKAQACESMPLFSSLLQITEYRCTGVKRRSSAQQCWLPAVGNAETFGVRAQGWSTKCEEVLSSLCLVGKWQCGCLSSWYPLLLYCDWTRVKLIHRPWGGEEREALIGGVINATKTFECWMLDARKRL